MYRYVLKRVKDTIEFGVNVRKSFACQQSINHKPQLNNDEKNKQNSVLRYQEINFLTPQSQRVNYDDFKKKYNCKHPNSCNPLLQAITWSTALIAGFYASQLLCLYRRNHHFNPNKCFYTRYLQHKNKLLHRKFFCAQKATFQNQSASTKFIYSQKNKSFEKKKEECVKSQQTNDDEFKLFVNEFARLNLFDKRFERFFNIDDDLTIGGHGRVFLTVNNHNTLSRSKEYNNKSEATSPTKSNNNNDNNNTQTLNNVRDEITIDEYEAIDKILTDLSEIIGELEFEMGVECIRHGHFEEAAEHFRMSSASNNASACFNLALLYEQGIGVKKDLKIALELYKIASDKGHDKALYNMGVYFAQGLGGTKKSFKNAKKCFEKAALQGNSDAMEALSLLLPAKKKHSLVPDDFIEVDSVPVENIYRSDSLQSIAVT